MLDLLRPTDDNGVPRRFGGHREAFLWAATSIAKMGAPQIFRGFAYAMVAWLAWLAVRSVYPNFMPGFFPNGQAWIFIVVAIPSALLTLLALGSILIYAYIALAGGVMRRDERKRPFS